jgi:hypothetical protein
MPKAKDNTTYSRDEIALFLDCPRCFYLARQHNVLRPAHCLVVDLPPEAERIKKQALIDGMSRVLAAGPPLQSTHCTYCNYRQKVRETGVENDLSG